MSHFLQNIIQRHSAVPQNVVQPRLNGVFEQGGLPFDAHTTDPALETPEAQNTVLRSRPEAFVDTRTKLSDNTTKASPVQAPPLAALESNPQEAPNPAKLLVQPRTALQASAQLQQASPRNQEIHITQQVTRQQTLEMLIQQFHNSASAAEEQNNLVPQMLPPLPPQLQNQANTPLQSAKNPEVPTVKIHIGRIEIKAVQAAAPPPQRNTPAPKAALSLEDYLKARKG